MLFSISNTILMKNEEKSSNNNQQCQSEHENAMEIFTQTTIYIITGRMCIFCMQIYVLHSY